MAIPDYMFEDLKEDFSEDPHMLAKIEKSQQKSLALRQELVAMRNTDEVPEFGQPGFLATATINDCKRVTYNCNNLTDLPGKQAADESTTEWTGIDSLVKIAHENAGVVRDYHKKCLDRNSYDGKGVNLLSCAHYDKDYDNAFFDGSRMVYGDGELFKPLVLAIDVASHEMGHGIVQSTCNLKYFLESGALNESFADVFGETCQHFRDNIKIADSDWLIGEEIIGDKLKAKGWRAIRSFKNEKAYPGDPQPKNKKKFVRTLEDNMGVHINSGIPNHVFYQFCVLSGCEYSFKEPLDVWYHSLFLLKSMSNFNNMHKATLKVCRERYPKLEGALVQAWKNVGY